MAETTIRPSISRPPIDIGYQLQEMFAVVMGRISVRSILSRAHPIEAKTHSDIARTPPAGGQGQIPIRIEPVKIIVVMPRAPFAGARTGAFGIRLRAPEPPNLGAYLRAVCRARVSPTRFDAACSPVDSRMGGADMVHAWTSFSISPAIPI
jgi:hypothetical protein